MEVSAGLYKWLVQHDAIDRSEQPGERNKSAQATVMLGKHNSALVESGVACATILHKVGRDLGQPSEWQPIRELTSMRAAAVYNWSEVVLMLRNQGVVVDQDTKALVLDGGN
jgi:hypothetical protein